MIGIINIEISNISSVKNSLDYLEIPNIVINKPDQIFNVDKLILPGVGSFGNGIKNLKKKGFFKILKEKKTYNKKPILGICLGMQLMLESSEENPKINGLSIIKGKCKKISGNLQIPHIGWNKITYKKNNSFFKKVKNSNFYFLHSYYCDVYEKKIISSSVKYGKKICSSFEKKNIIGVQFHPEKSQEEGLKLLKNFNDFTKIC